MRNGRGSRSPRPAWSPMRATSACASHAAGHRRAGIAYKAPDTRTADHIASRNPEDIAGAPGLALADPGYQYGSFVNSSGWEVQGSASAAASKGFHLATISCAAK